MQVLVYWRYEQSGKLATAVEHFLDPEAEFTEKDHQLLAYYLKIWADFPWQGLPDELEALRRRFNDLVVNGTRETIWQWLNQALQLGIDPL